jgi:hypothetical protein
MITPANILASLSDDPRLQAVAAEVESATKKMIDAAR